MSGATELEEASLPTGLPARLARHAWQPPANFLGLDPDLAEWADSAAAILPIPYEATTSWGSWGAGTRQGPAAILEASRYIELYDEELDMEPSEAGICTLPAPELKRGDAECALQQLRSLYGDLLEEAGDRLIIGLGGEHSVTYAPAVAWSERLGGELSVLQFDAHADLRDEYHGTPWNHACVLRRVLDAAPATRLAAVGLRAVTTEEMSVVRERGVTAVFAYQMRDPDWMERALAGLGDNVYITFDVDFFDPSLVPATGTPEPGGGDWWNAMDLLSRVFAERTVVGADVVELAPRPGQAASAFVAAKLVYKMVGWHVARSRR